MKKFGLFAVLGLATLSLAGCNCDCKDNQDEDAVLNQRIAYCNENGGTHSLIHSPTAVYGECAFPSGVTCEDTILGTDECNFEPNLEDIDTEEKRLAGCEENVKGWMNDMVQGAENVNIEWEDESEGGASFIRNGVIGYTKDGTSWTIDVECIADFVDGSLGVSYEDAVAQNNTETNEENVEENIKVDVENSEENSEEDIGTEE